ncbi:Putative SOS response-associated peptidase YedK [Halomicrobium zhouii]|uniref:Putative SOS response-associated peptidase YedK n=1 Tax=Halomicrobium zhouii TaxID=767519 RepID=A0A1I6L2S7_9EURY|nr:SOS response-associated peptidase [Halomicrobium zhouii]SFR97588.1 Putative SOS response-associated peptidase YedK [Halomicrobium zhouii]
MCGRTSLFLEPDDLEERFGAELVTDGGVDYRPRFNIAPGDDLEVITNEAPETIAQFQWGLVPSWADDPNQGMINARSETAAEKRSFGEAWERRPCLVPSTGFYEWQERDVGGKRPYRIYRDGDDPAFAMAGLWERWEGDGESLATVTILTTEPNDVVEPIHDRMPVILEKSRERDWLDAGPDERRELCRLYPGDDLDAYPISTAVNDPSHDHAGIIEEDESEQTGLGEFS